MNLNYFKNKKIFITGHTGFKGSWLMAIMHYLGAKIYCVSNEIPTNPSHYKILDLKITKDLRSDITDFDKIYKIISEIQPDFLFHLAAKPIVLDSIMNPYITFKTNTLGTINILETIRKLKKAPVSVIITSDKSYKNVEQKKGYKETDILGGDDPYSSSKASAEIAIQSYFNTYLKNKNKLIAVGRAGNVIGGGDWANHRIVVDTVKSWSINKPTILRNPHSTRPWQHVLDPLFGYIALALKLKSNSKIINGQAYNFGPNLRRSYSVIELVKSMQNYWEDAEFKIMKKKSLIDHESSLLKLNCNKAYDQLGWKSKINFKEATKLTAEWYKTFYLDSSKSVKKKTFEQIENYIKLLHEK